MPSIYAHYTFGEMMKKAFPADIRKLISLHEDLFEIGLHGPDLFFYYHALLKNRVNRTGYHMHDVSAAPFFRRSRDVILSAASISEKHARLAYILGFLCHFTLDSVCHSYIEKKLTEDPVTHSDIETEFDRYLLLKQNKRPLHAKVTSHLHASTAGAKAIQAFFPTLSVRQVESSISSMIWYNDLFTTSDRLTRSLVTFFMHHLYLQKPRRTADEGKSQSALRGQQPQASQTDGGMRAAWPLTYEKLCCIFQSLRTALALFPPYFRTKTRLGTYPGLILKRRAPLQT